MNKSKNKHGFSLIEASMMLVIFGVLVMIAIGFMMPLAKSNTIRKANKDLDNAMNALIADTKNSGNNLPTPSIPDNLLVIPSYINNAGAVTRGLGAFVTDSRGRPYNYFIGYVNGLNNVCRDAGGLLTIAQCDNATDNCTANTVTQNVGIFLTPADTFQLLTVNVDFATNVTTITVPYLGGQRAAARSNNTAITGFQGVNDAIFRIYTQNELAVLLGCPVPRITPSQLPIITTAGSAFDLATTTGNVVYWCIEVDSGFNFITSTDITLNRIGSANNCTTSAVYTAYSGRIKINIPAGNRAGVYQLRAFISNNAGMVGKLDQVNYTLIIDPA